MFEYLGGVPQGIGCRLVHLESQTEYGNSSRTCPVRTGDENELIQIVW